MTSGSNVQYGCGWCAPEGWRNFDGSPTLRLERIPVIGKMYTKNAERFPENSEYGDIVKGLPVGENSCDVVYCSHVLEHLALEDFRLALRNTHKMLKDGGTFRFVLPDLFQSASKYVQDDSPGASLRFLRDTCLGDERRPRSLKAFLVYWLGSSRHLWMWDYKSIAPELAAAGFSNIRPAAFGDSELAVFQAVEDKSRWEGCLGVDCQKPVQGSK